MLGFMAPRHPSDIAADGEIHEARWFSREDAGRLRLGRAAAPPSASRSRAA